jgi:hypothetical protein
MLVVLCQLVGLRRGARGVWLLPLCTYWHCAHNHLFVNLVIYVLMHVLSRSMHVCTDFYVCMLCTLHSYGALCTHMVLYMDFYLFDGAIWYYVVIWCYCVIIWCYCVMIWWCYIGAYYSAIYELQPYMHILFELQVCEGQTKNEKTAPLPCAGTWQRGRKSSAVCMHTTKGTRGAHL